MLTMFLLVFAGLMALGIPVAIALGGSAMAYILADGGLSLTMLVQTTFAGMSSFPLLAVPLFMLAGNLMNEGGITGDLVRFARLSMGHISGGLGLATILATAIFAAISGSAVATAVALGAVMIPAMRGAGYDEEVAASVTATASCMGPIIPPSIPFIIYGVIANVSSVFGITAWPLQSVYNSSKFAVRGFTETLWRELKNTGVRAVSIHPGGIKTNIVRSMRFRRGASSSANHALMTRLFDKMAATTAEDCAETIVRGIDDGDKRVLIGKDAIMLDRLQRTSPTGYPAVLEFFEQRQEAKRAKRRSQS